MNKMKTLLCILAFGMTSMGLNGCAGNRYWLGYNAGIREYKKGMKFGYFKRSYGVGYVKGFTLMKTLDDLEKSSRKLTDAVKELEHTEKPGVTDRQIKELLEQSFREVKETERRAKERDEKDMEKILRGSK